MTDLPEFRPVARRRVFYIPGFDPHPPRRYRELYRSEGAAQATISGYDLRLLPQAAERVAHGWRVQARVGEQQTLADIRVLVWSDIVRGSMAASLPATYLHLLRTAWIYIASGTLRRLMWLRKGPVIAALYPVGVLLLQLLGAVLLGALAGGLAVAGLRWLLSFPGWSGGVAVPLVRWAVLLGVAVAVLRWCRAQDHRIFAHYLMLDYASAAQGNGAYGAALEARLAAFADEIAAALATNVDEVLIVGHSSGAHLAVSVLADLLRARRVPDDGPAVGLLTLGQVVPMVSFLPEADRLRADLAHLASQTRITWVDVTAPGDGCCFALCDPVAVSGVAPPSPTGPLVISAAFTQTLSPARWKALRWRFFRLHFQYLCAFDRPGDYDYFLVTAGPMTLAQRFAGRAPSPARIDVPASKYRSMLM